MRKEHGVALWVAIVAMISLMAHASAARELGEISESVFLAHPSKAVPSQLNYQGHLVNAADSSAVTATLEMTFRLFDSETKGAELWAETHPSVEVQGGLFQVLLGSVTPFLDGLFDGSPLWLQTEIGPEILAPRKPMVSVAYSQMAEEAEHAAEADHAIMADQAAEAGEAQHAVHADTAAYSPSATVWTVSGDDVYRETGKVGIGTPSPLTELDVNGSVNATTYYGDGSHLTGIGDTTDDDWTIRGDTVYHEAGPVGIGTSSPTAPLTIQTIPGTDVEFSNSGSNADMVAAAQFNIGTSSIQSLHLMTSYLARMCITGTGQVGIGTTSPTQQLDVNGAVSATTYYGDGSNLTGISGTTDNDWTINGNDVYHETGNVGIGTTNPTLGRLEALASSGTGVYGGSSSGIGVFGYSANGQGVVGNSTTGHAGYFLGNVYTSGNVGVGTETPERQLHIKGTNPRILIEASSISPEVNFRNSDDTGPETWALYKHGTTDDFRFYQNGDKVTIQNSTGYVGIGTTSPISQLHIKEPSFPTYLTIESETGFAPGILLNVNGTIMWRMLYHPTDAMLSFYREGVGDKMVIKNNGDVGIGTSTPSYTVHVVDSTPNDDQPAIYGEHAVQDWWGVGVKGVGLFKGVEGVVSATGGEDYYGVYGEASSSGNGADVYGVYGKVTAGGTESYGVYGTSDVGAAVCGDRTGRQSYGWLGSWYRGAYGVNNSSSNSAGIEGQSYNGHGVHGYSDIGYAGYFSGDVHITGTLTGGKGSSTIDHPLDPENKLLRNNYVESPECLLIYRGKIRLDDAGHASVEMPEYFAALSNEDEATVNLTPIGRSASSERYEFCYEWQAGHRIFHIYGEPMREVAWMVMAERDDPIIRQLAQPVEEEKGPHSKVCDRGELLYPEAYGRPEAMGKDYQRREEIAKREKMPPRASNEVNKH